IDLLHVPYRGNGEALPDLLAGNVHSMFEAIVFPHVKAGKLVLLVMIDDERHPEFPDVPTIKEAGYPDYDLPIWFGVYAPAATPRAVVERLHNELAKLATDEVLRARVAAAGIRLYKDVDTLDQLQARLAQQTAVSADLIKRANITLE
ncbi:MAG: Bug family tripartite tricarboxylate transporter substrate binding protein, partial [Acetobacteraceae bacterium]